MTFKIVLRCMGLEPIFHLDPFLTNINNNYCCKIFLNWVYSIFIFLLLLYQPILETVLAIQKKEIKYFATTLFYYIIPIHYWIAFFYFRNQRTKRIYETENIKYLNNGSVVGKCMPEEKTLLKSIYGISLITIIDSILILFLYESPTFYKELSYGMDILTHILIILSFFPGRTVLVINSHIFFFSFLQQLHKLKSLEKKLRYKDWDSTNNTSVATLCYEIIDIRYTITRLIEKTDAMYMSTTIIGGISIGLILELGLWDYYTITCFVIYLIMQSVFLSVIYFIGNSRNEIKKIIHTRSFASNYILRKNDFCRTCLNVEKIYINKSNELKKVNKKSTLHSIKIEKNNELKLFNKKENPLTFIKKTFDESIDVENKLIENKLLENKLPENKLLENKLPENKLPENKLIEKTSSTADFYTPKDMSSSFEYSKDNVMTLLQKKEKSISNSSNFLSNNEYIRCIYEWSINTGSSVDWLILTNLLNQNWASFGLFGIEFSNGNALRNAILVTSSLIASGTAAGFLSKFI